MGVKVNPISGGGGSSGGLLGTWNASTNTPALANTDTGKTGYMYQVSTGGTVDFGAGNITFEAKDIVVNNGTVWDKIDGSDAVLSVNGNTGVVVLDKTDVGLSNVDNTADTAKPVSTAQQTALNLKANLASPTFTGTVNGITKSMVGLGNVDNTSDANKPISSATQTALNGKANSSHTHTESDITDLDKYTQSEVDSLLNDKVDVDGAKVLSDNNYTTTEKNKLSGIEGGAQVNTVTSVASKTGAVSLVKGDVGLGNVDNTSDVNKPISTSTQTALNGKANTSHTHSASDINSGVLSASRIPSNFTVQVNYSSAVSWDGLPPPTVIADSSGTYVDYPVTGAGVGRRVNVTLRGVTESNIIVRGEVTEANNVRVHYARVSGSTDLTEKIVDISIYDLNT